MQAQPSSNLLHVHQIEMIDERCFFDLLKYYGLEVIGVHLSAWYELFFVHFYVIILSSYNDDGKIVKRNPDFRIKLINDFYGLSDPHCALKEQNVMIQSFVLCINERFVQLKKL